MSGGGGASLALDRQLRLHETDAYGIGWKGTTSTGAACGAAHAGQYRPGPPLPAGEGGRDQVTVTPTNAAGDTFDVATYQFGADGAGVPTPPAGLTASAVSTSQINLSWQPSTDDIGVNSYKIVRDGSEVATVRGWTTTYADRGLPPNTAHTYEVVATDGNGKISDPPAVATASTKRQGTVLRFQPSKDTYVNADTRPPPTAPRPRPTPTTARSRRRCWPSTWLAPVAV